MLLPNALDPKSCLTMLQVLHEVASARRTLAVLSGPTFAKEVSRGLPAAAVAASSEPAVATWVQGLLSTAAFRVYAGSDP